MRYPVHLNFISLYLPPQKKSAMINFDNTEIAFKIKNKSALQKANFLFGLMNNQSLVKMGTSMAQMALNLNLPVKTLIKKTIFEQFCGGESLEESKVIVDELKKYQVQSILDYAIEAKSGEAEFDNTLNELMHVVDYAASANVPFVSVKVTGLARFELLEKLQANI